MKENQIKSGNYSLYSLILTIIIVLLISCNKDSEQNIIEKGTVQFTINANQTNEFKSAGPSLELSAKTLVVSVEKISGEKIFTLRQFQLLKFGDKYITDPIALEVGEYKITDFLVADANGDIIYATPKEGSPNEGSVDDALPIAFVVKANNIKNLSPQVIGTLNSAPSNFGYETFSFDIVETFNFLIGVFSYNDTNNPVPLTGSNLIISNKGTELYNGELPSVTTALAIPGRFENYTVCVVKKGYARFYKTFTKAELLEYSEPDGSPLIVILKAQTEGLVLWNTLGSIEEIKNSEVGVDGIFMGGSFIPGIFGNAYCAKYYQDTLVQFNHTGIIPTQKGCIEFWSKLSNPNYSVTHGPGNTFGFINYSEGDGNFFCFNINANNGLSSGGIATYMRNKGYNNFSSCGTQQYTDLIPLSSILGIGKEESWHHYAVVWDNSGLQDINLNTRKIVIYLDGVINTTFWHVGYVGDYIPWDPAEASLKLLFNTGTQGTMEIDNLKIWNYAKTDFSDRFEE